MSYRVKYDDRFVDEDASGVYFPGEMKKVIDFKTRKKAEAVRDARAAKTQIRLDEYENS